MAGKNYTKIKDLVTGSEGSAYITIDGQNRYFFELSKIEANIEFTVIAKKLLGHRMKQHKVVAAEGKGSITMYNVSPVASSKSSKVKSESVVFRSSLPSSRYATGAFARMQSLITITRRPIVDAGSSLVV